MCNLFWRAVFISLSNKYTCSLRRVFYFLFYFYSLLIPFWIFKYLLDIFYLIIQVSTTSLLWGFVSIQICILKFFFFNFVCLAVMNQYVFFTIFPEIKVSSSTFRKKLYFNKILRLGRVYSATHSCLTLCDPKDYNPPSSSGYRISQARILEQPRD